MCSIMAHIPYNEIETYASSLKQSWLTPNYEIAQQRTDTDTY